MARRRRTGVEVRVWVAVVVVEVVGWLWGVGGGSEVEGIVGLRDLVIW